MNSRINWEFASQAHHKTIGCIERVNQTLWFKLRKLCEYGKKNWERCVPKAIFSVNISFSRSNGTSTYLLYQGGHPQLDIDRTLGKPEINVNRETLIKNREEIQKRYLKDIVKGKIEIKQKINPGDKVLVFKKNLSNKLLTGWTRGFRVVEPDVSRRDAPSTKKILNNTLIFRGNPFGCCIL